ncbi:MAG: DUF1847 domain-containing protein [Promethearchaeota archaeon]
MNPTCHKCNSLANCTVGHKSELENCPMNQSEEILKRAEEIYTQEQVKITTKNASIVEATGYIKWPRLKDTIEYARLMGYKKLGLAFCVGLQREARRVAIILEKYGFEISSVCCKTGSVKKSDLEVPKEYIMKSKTGYIIGFIACNPVGQALILNKAETDMNIICGLCVGHDITFTQYSKAPVTTLIAKDRSNNHSPASVLYTSYGEAFFNEDLRKLNLKK